MGQIITFYSYKGGVGRSMALANIAILLSRWGYKTLIIDWDLEAPGLEYFFQEYFNINDVCKREGVIDLLYKIMDDENSNHLFSWKQMLFEISIENHLIHFMSAGKKDKKYYNKVRSLDLENLYLNNGGYALETIREEWKHNYDFVLIDSRTGITDIGGVCTVHLPDILLLLFTATRQSIYGSVEVARKANKTRKNLPVDRLSLLSLPILSRFDSTEEFKISQSWIDKSSSALKDVCLNWLPRKVDMRTYFEITKIPYIPYFSFGEKLPIIEQGTNDPASIGFSYETISALIANNLENVDTLLENRSSFIDSARNKTFGKKQHYVPKIFISCSRFDSDKAKLLYQDLIKSGYQPWLDVNDLLPGVNRTKIIKREIDSSDFFIACLSSNAYSKNSYFHSEIDYALKKTLQRNVDNIFFIPVRFDDFKINMNNILYQFQWVNLYEDDGLDKLKRAINNKINKIESSRAVVITTNSNQYISIRKFISGIQEGSLKSGLLYEKGKLNQGESRWEIILCEIGTMSNYAANVINELVQFFNPRAIFNLGFSAGVGKAKSGDLVVSTNAYFFDSCKNINSDSALNTIITSTVSLEQRARLEAKKGIWKNLINDNAIIRNKKPKVLFGACVVTPNLVLDNKKCIIEKYPDILAIELESHSILSTFKDIPKKCDILTLRGIVDYTDTSKNENYIDNITKNISLFLLEVLDNFGE